MPVPYAKLSNVKARQLKRVPTSDGLGKMWTFAGYIVGDVEIHIDISLLRDLAERAVRNRNKKSVLHHGAVVLKAVNLRNEGI